MTDRIYKVEIVAYPDDRYNWQPVDWDEDRGEFYWPSTKRLYRSRSAAMARKALIESYGATTRILVSPVVWEDLDEYTRQQRLMRARVRADKLRRQADEIERAAA